MLYTVYIRNINNMISFYVICLNSSVIQKLDIIEMKHSQYKWDLN